jgi:tRNA nucleotidyltransferase/poly(A) polymerase
VLLERLAALERGLGLEPNAILRLAALAVEVVEHADNLRERLRLSNEEHARLVRLASRTSDISPAAPERAAKAYLYAGGEAAYRDRMLVAWARSGAAGDNEPWRKRLALPERWQPPRFPIGGAEVMALGIPAGPRVGEMLRELEAWWVTGDFAANEDALRVKLRELARGA